MKQDCMKGGEWGKEVGRIANVNDELVQRAKYNNCYKWCYII